MSELIASQGGQERRGDGQSQYAAVFPALEAGDYTVWDPEGEPTDRITVAGGSVSQLDWR